MDTQRLVLLMIFGFSLIMLWEGWQKQHAPVATVPGTSSVSKGGSVEPTTSIPKPSSALEKSTGTVPAEAASKGNDVAGSVHVSTDLFEGEVSLRGGDLVVLELKRHRATGDTSRPFRLLDNGSEHVYEAQSGLLGADLPTHKTVFASSAKSFAMADAQSELEVRLAAPESAGVQVTKVLRFHRGSYIVDVGYEIENKSSSTISPNAYFQLIRDGTAPASESSMVRSFTGAAVYTEADKFQKVEFDAIGSKAKHATRADNGWIGMIQHYFVSAWLPEGKVEREYFTRKLGDNLYAAGVIVPTGAVAAGSNGKVSIRLYAGPQEQNELEKLAAGLHLVVDYGWLTPVAAPIFWVLQWLHGLVGNWGWAIILLTVLIKAAFFPLSAASYKSMARMRLVTPRMMKIKEQYGHDRARMNQEMMELYKKERINPLGGCLPIVVQIPVFIALYWVLLAAVEMRHAPWILWIQDLSTKDPYFVLPLIMGATMLVQTKLNPTPPDPIQAKVMLAMPIVFTGMFLFFPSGLVLYWVVNNLLSIAQQWQITRMTEGGRAKATR